MLPQPEHADAEVLKLIIEEMGARSDGKTGFEDMLREQADTESLQWIAVINTCALLDIETVDEFLERRGEVVEKSAGFLEGFIAGSIFRRQMIPIDWRRDPAQRQATWGSLKSMLDTYEQIAEQEGEA